MKHLFYILLLNFIFNNNSFSQEIDTITTHHQAFKHGKFKSENIKHSYITYFTDSLGQRKSSVDIWDRELKIEVKPQITTFNFRWKVYSKDSLILETEGNLILDSEGLKILDYTILRNNKAPIKVYNEDTKKIITISAKSRNNKDTTITFSFDGKAFIFPMDLELLPLFPIKKLGQKMMLPFYEPASLKYQYYLCEVIGEEKLELNNTINIDCWLLKLYYKSDGSNYAWFWVDKKNKEVIKTKNSLMNGMYRHKQKIW